jgi:integrase
VDVVADYVEGYCKPNQRTWSQTEYMLTVTCAKLAKRPFDAIERGEVLAMLDGFAVKESKPYKASLAFAHLKRLWRWAHQRQLCPAAILDGVAPEYELRSRDRVFSDNEVAAIWRAADALPDPIEGAYWKLCLLLAPRKSALALMRRSHLDNADAPTAKRKPWRMRLAAAIRRPNGSVSYGRYAGDVPANRTWRP